jgi:hypothetical protein
MSLVDDIVVKMVFDDATSIDITARNYLMGYNTLLEMDTSNEALTGSISANELNISLFNDEGLFTPSNPNSPYFNKMGYGVKLVVTNGGLKVGTFYVTKWDAPNKPSSKRVSITAVDRLQGVLNNPVSITVLERDVMVKDYLTRLLTSVGVLTEDLVIDQTLTQVLAYTIVEGKKLSEILNSISNSADCYIYTNADDKIVARSKEVTGVSMHEISGASNLYSFNPAKSVLQSSNTLVLNYTNPSMSDVKELISMKGKDVAVGSQEFTNLKVTDGNIYDIDSVKALATNKISVSSLACTHTSIDFSIDVLFAEKIDISVFGRTIVLNDRTFILKDDLLIAKQGRSELSIDCRLVQDDNTASVLANKIWSRVNLDTPFILANTIDSDLIYNLGDIVNVVSQSANLTYLGYAHSIKSTWNGGDGIRVEIGIKALSAQD